MNELPPEVLIDRDQILPDSSQPRKVFDEEAIKALREDIKINGLKEPIDINPLLDGRSTKYLTIDGECRTKATESLEGYEQLPCRLYKYKSQRQIDKHRASKHFHRKDWNPADRAVWLKYYIETHKLRQQDLAREFSVTHATISQWLAPTRDPAVLNALRTGDISFTQAMHLSRIDDAETRSEALLRAKKDEGEDKHKTETETKEIVKSLHSTPEIAQDTTTADIEHRQKGEESESEITDREALINQISEDLRERFTNDTKDFNLHDIERIVKLIEHGVVMHDAIRTVKLSQTDTPEKTEKGEGELPVNDGEGTTEDALTSPETDPIVSKAFERGGEKGTEEAVLDESITSPDAMLTTQSPLPEEGVEVTPGSDPSPETKVIKFVNRMLRLGEATTTHMKEKELEALGDADYRKILKDYEEASFEIDGFRDFLHGRENNGSVQFNRAKRLHNAIREFDAHSISSTNEATNLRSIKIETKKKLTKDVDILDNIINGKGGE